MEYKIGDIINNNWEIIDIFKKTNTCGKTVTMFKTRCLKCGHISDKQKSDALKRKICLTCRKEEYKSIIGERFGRLVVQKICKERASGGGHVQVECLCDCGNIKVTTISRLKRGTIRSCGCLAAEGNNYSHRLSNTRLYNIWIGIKTRCYNPNHGTYQYYGAKGITMCPEWKEDFMNFYNWAMENGYNDNLSIDRIDPEGNYCPENCKWADSYEQANNKRKDKLENSKGMFFENIVEVCKMYNVPYNDVEFNKDNGTLKEYLDRIEIEKMNELSNLLHSAKINEDYYYNRTKEQLRKQFGLNIYITNTSSFHLIFQIVVINNKYKTLLI